MPNLSLDPDGLKNRTRWSGALLRKNGVTTDAVKDTDTEIMMKHYEIVENRVIQSTQGVAQVLVAISPDDRERALLQERFFIDDYDLSSILDPDEVPRLDLVDGRLFLIWKLPHSATVSEAVELGTWGQTLIIAIRDLLNTKIKV